MSIPGMILSQLGMRTRASKGCPMVMTSTESAMSSRLASEYFIPDVPHGDPVANADGGELHGGAAGHADARLHMLGDGAQVDVPRDDLVVGVDDPDQGACDLLVGVTHGLEERPVGRPLHAFFHQVASHVSLPLDVHGLFIP